MVSWFNSIWLILSLECFKGNVFGIELRYILTRIALNKYFLIKEIPGISVNWLKSLESLCFKLDNQILLWSDQFYILIKVPEITLLEAWQSNLLVAWSPPPCFSSCPWMIPAYNRFRYLPIWSLQIQKEILQCFKSASSKKPIN